MQVVKSFIYYRGRWIDGAEPVFSSLNHGFVYAMSVFDGARAFDGLVPDLDLHCSRVLESAKVLNLSVTISAKEILAIALDGIARFPAGSHLYIRPVVFAGDGDIGKSSGAEFAMTICEAPMLSPTHEGIAICLSSFRRPDALTAPTTAKAACLYPLNRMAIAEAQKRGFNNAVMRSLEGHVLELATANLWYAKGGIVYTAEPSPLFLNGITRQRVKELFETNGQKVVERVVNVDDLHSADEIFTTGNMSKVLWVNRFEERQFTQGPMYRMAKSLYWSYASTQSIEKYLRAFAPTKVA